MYIRERFFMGFFYNAIKDWKAFARDLGNVYLNKISKSSQIFFAKKNKENVTLFCPIYK